MQFLFISYLSFIKDNYKINTKGMTIGTNTGELFAFYNVGHLKHLILPVIKRN